MKISRIELSNLFQLVAAWILVFLSAVLITASLLFFFRVSITPWTIVPSLFLSIPISWWLARRTVLSAGWKRLAVATVLLFIAVSVITSGAILDVSWDGLDYQQPSVIRLMDGFNPIYDVALPGNIYYNAWLNHYPKGPWVFEAALYALTSNIETGKSLHWLLLGAALCTSLTFFLRLPWLKTWQGIVVALLLAFNPVTINQTLSFYVDGMGAALMMVVVLNMLLFKVSDPVIGWLALASSLIIGLNIKFTATAYLGFFVAVVYLFLLFTTRARQAVVRLTASLAVGGLLGLLVVGYNPYVTNTIRHGNPLYPLVGGEEINQSFIMGGQGPADFAGQTRWVKLARSLFSRSGNLYGERVTERKFPFSVNRLELEHSVVADLRIGGFGPWFSGILLICIAILLAGVRENLRHVGIVMAILLTIFISTLFNEESWWARYSPQFWWLAVVTLVFGFSRKWIVSRIGSVLLTVVMFVNLSMLFGPYLVYNVRSTRAIDTQLKTLAQQPETVVLYIGRLRGWIARLEKYNISYTLVEDVSEVACPQALFSITYSQLPCP